MFRGTYNQKVDDKGRVNVPQRFRDVLKTTDDDRLLITNSRVRGVRCLDAFPYAAWVKFEQDLEEHHADWDPEEVNFLVNYYVPSVQECPVDKQGRILLPQRLRDFAGLGKDVLFIGAVHMFRLWDPVAWAPVFDSAEQVLVKNPTFMPGFRLKKTADGNGTGAK